MVTKKSVNVDYRPNIQLKVQPLYTETLFNEVLPYTLEYWGAVVMVEFLKEINTRILMLYSMPDANPKNQYLVSTTSKIYRNIILSKYPYVIVYSVKKNIVTVLNIIHQSRNPKIHKELIKPQKK